MPLRLLTRKPCFIPTLAGWLSLSTIAIALMCLIVFNLHSFLSPTKPSGADVLIVEGWLPDYALDSAAALVNRCSYRRIVVTGGVLEQGSYLKEYKTHAELGAATLRAIGIPDSLITAVPAPFSAKDRTYISAVTLAPWIRAHGIRSFDVCSLGAHSRRSRFLFQKAVGDSVNVGVRSIEDAGYDGKKWWISSMGFKTVTGEMIAYFYVRLIFRP
jgi:uncharacterized SAM-binding protein YcdF (DUF218 family)